MKKSWKEIDALKASWLADPSWDLEDTEGFEDYKDELRRFQWTTLAEQHEVETSRIQELANDAGCSFKCAEYIDKLETRIERLEEKLSS